VLVSGSVLLHTWKQLSTPNLASVLDVRRGVWVRGAMEQSGEGVHGTVTCQHSRTIVTQSHVTGLGDFQSNQAPSSNISNTSSDFRMVAASSSGILSRGFMAAVDRRVGLASILDPDPCNMTSCREQQPNDIHNRISSHSQLKSINIHRETSQCQKVVRGTLCSDASSDFESNDVCDLSSDLQRPSNDLQTEGDLYLLSDRPGTSSLPHYSSPLCCSYSRPSTLPCGVLSTPSSTPQHTVVSPSYTGSSLYDELRPYLTDDDTTDAYSSGVTTDDEY